MFSYIKGLVITVLAISAFIIAGCGAGTSSSSGSLAISVDNATVTGGDVVMATVTLTSSTGKPVRGVAVRVMSTDQNAIADATGSVNDNGVAIIALKVGWVDADKVIYLAAGSDYASSSTSVKVTVTAPKLTITIPNTITPAGWTYNYAFTATTFVSNYSVKFVDGNANPISGQVIKLSVDSLVKGPNRPNDWVFFSAVLGSQNPAPPAVYSSVTDNSGIINIPMYIQMDLAKPYPCTTNATTGIENCTGTFNSVMTIKWRAEALYAGHTYTTYSDSLVTFTNTGK